VTEEGYVYSFVEQKTGKSHWYLIPSVNTQWLNVVLKTFAAFEEATAEKIILLVQDIAGWHRSAKLQVPTGIF
jgi:hypothetical protein